MNILLICHHRRHKIFMRPLPLAEALTRRGHRVDLLCIADTDRRRFREETVNDVRIVETPDVLSGRMRSGWDPVSIVRRIGWISRQPGDWHIIQAQETRPATIYPIRWLRRRRAIPVVMDWIDWWGHGGLIAEARPIWYRLLFGRLETFFEEAFRQFGDGHTIISKPLVERACALGVPPECIHLLRNGVERSLLGQSRRIDATPGARDELRRRFGIPLRAQVLMFSAIDVFFDVELLIGSLKHLVPEFPDILLVTTGQKSLKVEQLSARARVSSRVLQLGRLSVEDYRAVLACADLFALPLRDTVSNRGRWPSKLCDYMAAGRPLVANPVGDAETVIRESAAGVTAAYEPSSFADACAALLRDPVRRAEMGCDGRTYVEAHLLWDTLVAGLDEFYRAILARWQASERRRIHEPA